MNFPFPYSGEGLLFGDSKIIDTLYENFKKNIKKHLNI